MNMILIKRNDDVFIEKIPTKSPLIWN